jgi:sodium/proline symporter
MAIILSFCFFIFLMVAVGNIAALRGNHNSSEDYLVGGRSHGKFMIALSGASSATSGFVMIGAVGAGYSMGLIAVLMPLGWLLGDILFWTLFPDRINRKTRDMQCDTIPEYLSISSTGVRNTSIRKFFALIIIVFLGLYAIGQFLAAGKAINAVFNLDIAYTILLSAVIIAAYSAKGGLMASIPTQVVQALIMLFTTIGLFLLALYLGGGPGQLIENIRQINPQLLSLDNGNGVLLFLVFFLGFSSSCIAFNFGQPHLLVRIMATKSPEEAAKVRWIYIAFMQATWVSMSLFGLLMTVLLPEVSDPEQALPIFARENLHPIFAGAVMAGIFAAVASTLDGQILALSSALSTDLMPQFYERMQKKIGIYYQMASTLLVIVVTALLTLLFIDSTTVFTLIIFSSTVLGASMGFAVFICIMGWKTRPVALAAGAVTALIISVSWRIAGLNEYMIEGFQGFVGGLLVHYLVMKLFYSDTISLSTKDIVSETNE